MEAAAIAVAQTGPQYNVCVCVCAIQQFFDAFDTFTDGDG